MDADELAYLYRDVFESDRRGALLLEDLIRRFSKPAQMKGENAVIETFHRLGARSVVDHIVGQINRANGVRENEPQEGA